jgi:hypothetical protein
MAKTKSEAELNKMIRDEHLKVQARKKELLEIYRNEEKVAVHISPMYRPHFGNVLILTINGITIGVPVDGNAYKVPKTFAEHVSARVAKIDAIIKKTNKMADVKSNFESSPGELELF